MKHGDLQLTENFRDVHFAAEKTVNNRDEPRVPALELFLPQGYRKGLLSKKLLAAACYYQVIESLKKM